MQPMPQESGRPPSPVEILQHLIHFDTTNPPGNEAACVNYVRGLLTRWDFEPQILALDPDRPNLIARLKGRGHAPPLLLQGHVDVVTTANQTWTEPPFGGALIDGYLWGRGALDMKSGVAMMLAALLRAKQENLHPAGDILLAIVSDEEAGGHLGARFLVERHPDLFEGVRYAIGEFGGFSFWIAGRKFYPIQVSERQACYLEVRLRGPSGHGSFPFRGGAMAQLGRLLQELDRHRLPIHITATVQQMLTKIASAVPFPANVVMRQLLNPQTSDYFLRMLGQQGETFLPLLRNTVNATAVHGGESPNVIPSEVTVLLDGRLLPGFSPADLIRELRPWLEPNSETNLVQYEPGPSAPDMGLFPLLESILNEADPGGIPIPYLLPASTDARYFSRLGIQTYGFLPMNLPSGFKFSQLIHAADERVPAVAVEFGTEAVYELLRRYC